MPDFLSTNLGSIVLLSAETDAGRSWLHNNVHPDHEFDVDYTTVNVEPRFFLDIAYALLEAGLTLQDTATGLFAELPETVH